MTNRVDRPFRLAWKNLVRFIASFVDDIHLGSMTLEDLLAMILEVLRHLATLNYSVVPQSIQYGTVIDALGPRVSLRGATIWSRHQATIAALQPASSPKALNAFLSYFRGYVLHFSAKTKEIPLFNSQEARRQPRSQLFENLQQVLILCLSLLSEGFRSRLVLWRRSKSYPI